MTTTMTLSAAQEAAYNLLKEKGVVRHDDLSYHQRQSFKALEVRHLAKWREGENGFEWFIPEYDQAPPRLETETATQPANLIVAEIAEETAVEVVPPPTKFEPSRWQHVEALKAFPKKGEAGVWIQGRYMGVLPGDPRYVSVRINGLPEAVKVGDVRPAVGQDVTPLAKPAAVECEIVREITISVPRETWRMLKDTANSLAEELGQPVPYPPPTMPTNGAIEDAEFTPVPQLPDDGIIVAEDGYDPRTGTPFATDQIREFVSVSTETEPTLDDIEGAIVSEMFQEAVERADETEEMPVVTAESEDTVDILRFGVTATCDYCELNPRMDGSRYCEQCAQGIVSFFTGEPPAVENKPFVPEVGMTIWWENADGTDGHTAHVLGLFPTHASIVWFKQHSYPEPSEHFLDVPLAELHETNTMIVTCESVIYEHQVASGQPFPASITPYFVRPVIDEPKAEETAEDMFGGLADFTPPLHITPVDQRGTVRMETLNLTPNAFRQSHRGIVTSSEKVFSRNNAWKGQGWVVGKWTNRMYLVLLVNGSLILMDGSLAYEVEPRKPETLEILFTAWAGLGWREAQQRVSAIIGGVK